MYASAITLERKFDVAISFQVIEHMHDLDNYLDQIKNVVKSGGKIIITTPNVRNPEGESDNPFHFNEMNEQQMCSLMAKHFKAFEIKGVAFAKPNKLRTVLSKLPIYRLGRYLKRKSNLKKVATKALNLTSFRIISENIHEEASDLLAICVRD